MIEIPYMMALRIPAALDLLCFVKKLTVIGIIGNTQGVRSAAKPLKNDRKKISHMDFPSSSSSSCLSSFSTLSLLVGAVGVSVTDSMVSEIAVTLVVSSWFLVLSVSSPQSNTSHDRLNNNRQQYRQYHNTNIIQQEDVTSAAAKAKITDANGEPLAPFTSPNVEELFHKIKTAIGRRKETIKEKGVPFALAYSMISNLNGAIGLSVAS